MVMMSHDTHTHAHSHFQGQSVSHACPQCLDGFHAPPSLSSQDSTLIDFSTALVSILHNGPFILLSVTCSCLIKPTESLSVHRQNGRHLGAACSGLGVGVFRWSCVHIYWSKSGMMFQSNQAHFFFRFPFYHIDKNLHKDLSITCCYVQAAHPVCPSLLPANSQ